MEKNQIFIKSGTEYKKITKELLAESNLAELIGDREQNGWYQAKHGFGIGSVKWCHDTYGDHCRNPGISEGKWLPQNSMILEGSWVGDRTCRCI